MLKTPLSIILTMLEVGSILVPLVAGIFLLFRTKESYAEGYEHSKFKFWGMSKRFHRITLRLAGLLLLAIAALTTWKFYFAEEDPVSPETKHFWEDVDKKNDGESGFLFKFSMLGAAIAIPTRMGSTRFRGKPLAKLCGKTVLERVYEKCLQSKLAKSVIILSDSPEIEQKAAEIGAPHMMTSANCSCGTERILSVLDKLNADFVVNVQGDEPFIEPALIDAVIEKRLKTGADLVTAARRIKNPEDLPNPNIVKVLRDNAGKVLYFSRSPLPYVRAEADYAKWLQKSAYWHHIGLYGYSAKALKQYSTLPQSALENAEMLEQLKFVAAGYTFELVETDYISIGIDTPEDLEKAEAYLKTIS